MHTFEVISELAHQLSGVRSRDRIAARLAELFAFVNQQQAITHRDRKSGQTTIFMSSLLFAVKKRWNRDCFVTT